MKHCRLAILTLAMLSVTAMSAVAQIEFEPIPTQLYHTSSNGQIDAPGGSLVFSSPYNGVYVSDDKGGTWRYAGLRGMRIWNFVTLDASTFFACTGDDDYYSTRNIFVTSDTGKSWTQIWSIGYGRTTLCNALGADEVFFRCEDRQPTGTSPDMALRWRKGQTSMDTLFFESDEHISHMVATAPKRYACIRGLQQYWRNSGIYISEDDGLTWTKKLDVSNLYHIDLDVDRSGALIFSYDVPDTPHKTYIRSVDNGNTWHTIVDECLPGTMLQDPHDGSLYLLSRDGSVRVIDTATHTAYERSFEPKFTLTQSQEGAEIINVCIDNEGNWHLVTSTDEYYYSSDKFAGFQYKYTFELGAERWPQMFLSQSIPQKLAYFPTEGTPPGTYGITRNGGNLFEAVIGLDLPSTTRYSFDGYGDLYRLRTFPERYNLQTGRWDTITTESCYGSPRFVMDPTTSDMYRHNRSNFYGGWGVVMYSSNRGRSWESILSRNKTPFDYVVAVPSGKIYCLIGFRVYSATRGKWIWEKDSTMENVEVHMIDADMYGNLYALGPQAVYRLSAENNAWSVLTHMEDVEFVRYRGYDDPCWFDVNLHGDIFLYDFANLRICFYDSDSEKWSYFNKDLFILEPRDVLLDVSRRVFLSTKYGIFRGTVSLTPEDSGGSGPDNPGSDDSPVARSFELHGNHPNPFAQGTQIDYTLPTQLPVTIYVTDALGRTVLRRTTEIQSAGAHSRWLDLTGYPEGLYFYTVRAGDAVQTKKMMLVK